MTRLSWSRQGCGCRGNRGSSNGLSPSGGLSLKAPIPFRRPNDARYEPLLERVSDSSKGRSQSFLTHQPYDILRSRCLLRPLPNPALQHSNPIARLRQPSLDDVPLHDKDDKGSPGWSEYLGPQPPRVRCDAKPIARKVGRNRNSFVEAWPYSLFSSLIPLLSATSPPSFHRVSTSYPSQDTTFRGQCQVTGWLSTELCLLLLLLQTLYSTKRPYISVEEEPIRTEVV